MVAFGPFFVDEFGQLLWREIEKLSIFEQGVDSPDFTTKVGEVLGYCTLGGLSKVSGATAS